MREKVRHRHRIGRRIFLGLSGAALIDAFRLRRAEGDQRDNPVHLPECHKTTLIARIDAVDGVAVSQADGEGLLIIFKRYTQSPQVFRTIRVDTADFPNSLYLDLGQLASRLRTDITPTGLRYHMVLTRRQDLALYGQTFSPSRKGFDQVFLVPA